MSKRIISQDGTSRTEESYEFLLAGNQIFAVGHDLNDEVTEKEDCTGRGLKDHIVELGIYESEEKAHTVWIALHSWINGNLNKGENLFNMPAYDDDVTFLDERMIVKENLLERFGEPENVEGKQLIPLLDIKMMSDERQKEIAEECRRAHPELYTPECLEEYRKAVEILCNIPGIRNVLMNK